MQAARPVGQRRLVGRVVSDQLEIDFVVTGRDGVLNNDTILEKALQFHDSAIAAGRNQFGRVADHSLPPFAIR